MSTRRTPSHWSPRTPEGWWATLLFVVLFLATMPPVTHRVLDRPEVWIAGVPLLYAALFVLYTALIAVLVWAYRRGV